MNVKDLQEYLARFKPDDNVEFVTRDSDGDIIFTSDARLEYRNTPSINVAE